MYPDLMPAVTSYVENEFNLSAAPLIYKVQGRELDPMSCETLSSWLATGRAKNVNCGEFRVTEDDAYKRLDA